MLIEEACRVPINFGSVASEVPFSDPDVVKGHDQLVPAAVPGPSKA